MRYAFFGDVHGNLQAFEAVLKEIDAAAPDAVYCLGDTIGYGADPAACLDLLRARNIPSVAGNHDLAACGKLPTHCFNDDALRSIQWTHDALDAERLEYVASLPLTLKLPGVSLAHSTLAEPELFGYILNLQDAARCLIAHAEAFAFVAHTHVPVCFLLNGSGLTFSTAASCRFPASSRAVVNVGSVGQPRDGNPKAGFCLFDAETRSLEMRRVEYDIEGSARRILAAGLPSANALRLWLGA